MKSILKMGQTALFIVLALIFVTTTVWSAGPEEFKIPPKGKKQIKIGSMDLNGSIELGAYFNKLHEESAKARGWQVMLVDLKDNDAEGPAAMENMISAGYDGIIIHFKSPRGIEKQIRKAFDKGIPVITMNCQAAQVPGVVLEVTPMDAASAATVAEFIASKLGPNDQVITVSIPMLDLHKVRLVVAHGVFQAYNRKVAQDLSYPLTGDPWQWAYDQTKNALLADTKKEIKGVWSAWEGFGVMAARAAHDLGRDDVIVATNDDSANTYAQIAKLPTMWGAVAFASMAKEINAPIFALLDKVFKGQQVPSNQLIQFPARLITKENLPPKGYYFNPCGGYKGPPDFVVK